MTDKTKAYGTSFGIGLLAVLASAKIRFVNELIWGKDTRTNEEAGYWF